jgi:inner membrane transporter RhtA
MFTAQIAAALSTRLIPTLGPLGMSWLRLTWGALLVVLIARPWRLGWTRRDVRSAAVLGVVTGVMTMSFLSALQYLPLGTTVAIEFLGPLTVAVVRAHTRAGLAWPVLALLGVVVLTRPWTGEVTPRGIALAATAGAAWGVYILLTQHIGDRVSGLGGLAVSIPVAALMATIVGLPHAWGHLSLALVAQGLFIAMLMPVATFGLEMVALRRLTAAAFGTLMALEPGVATLIGAAILAQRPSPWQVLGIALVVVAGVGAERTGRRATEPEPVQPNPLGS